MEKKKNQVQEPVKTPTLKEIKDTHLGFIAKDLYNAVRNYIYSKGGFIDTQNKDGKKNNIFADAIELGGVDGTGEQRTEKYIYGIKVVNNDILIADEYINLEEEKPVWEKEDFEKDNVWKSLLHSQHFIILPTLFCIADTIEEYGEDISFSGDKVD